MRRLLPIAFSSLVVLTVPRLTWAQSAPVVTIEVDTVRTRSGPTLVLAGDTLRWRPLAPDVLRASGAQATADTMPIVVLFAADTVYELSGGQRVPVAPPLVRIFRKLRAIAEMDRWLREMDFESER